MFLALKLQCFGVTITFLFFTLDLQGRINPSKNPTKNEQRFKENSLKHSNLATFS